VLELIPENVFTLSKIMNKELVKKLKIKPGYSLLILKSPEGYLTRSSKADTKITSGKKYDFIQIFVTAKADTEKLVLKTLKTLKDNGLLWIAYPKKSSSIKTDVSRDYGWDTLTNAGYEAVAQVSIDDTWTALRFSKKEKARPAESSMSSSERMTFTAILERPDDGIDGSFVFVPFDVEKVYGTKGQVKVKAWFDGYPYRGILANMGMGSHMIIVRKDIRQAIGKNPGDKITVELELDTEERVVEVPDDLKKMLALSGKAEQFFNSLSYTNRKEYVVWITAAKKMETREKRLSDTIQKLLKGKKNPAQK
jgi:hypothetical protein